MTRDLMRIIIPVILVVLHGLCLAQVPSGITEYRVQEKHQANKTRVLMEKGCQQGVFRFAVNQRDFFNYKSIF